MSEERKVIMGIDPGTVFMGIGIIGIEHKQLTLISMDVLKMSSNTPHFIRLQKIYDKIAKILKLYQPDEFAIEAPFYGKNVQSMLKLGRAQGVAIAAALQYGIPVEEYSPRKIKQSVTGNGNADKVQVLSMLQRILKFEETPTHLDATDAVAVAVCHYFQHSGTHVPTGKSKGWDDFLRKNPSRIVKGNR